MKTYKELLEKINIARAKMGDVIKDFQDSDAPQFEGKSAEKRRQMAIAAKLEADRGVKEEVEELDELSKETKASYMKKAGAEIDKHWDKSKTDARSAYKYYGRKNTMKKIANEEVEELDELSQDKLMQYRKSARKQGTGIQDKMKVGGGDWSKDGKDTKTLKKRMSGYQMAGRKVNPGLAANAGKAPRVAATEEVDLDEGKMKELVTKHMEAGHDYNAATTKAKKDLEKMKTEALKGDQHKIDANKNGKVDGHDFKILRNAKKARYQ
jgi:hypothetical protein